MPESTSRPVWRPLRAALGFAALALVSAGVAGCQGSAYSEPGASGPTAAEAPPRVQVTAAQLQPWPRSVSVQGSLLGDERAVIGAKVAGRVKKVLVDMGTQVRQDDVLAILETEEFDLRVQEAQAQLEQALAKLGLKPHESEAKLDRTRVPTVVQQEALRNQARANLTRAKSLETMIAQEEFEERQAELDVAEARYGSALNDVEEQVATVGIRRAALALAKQNRVDAEARAPFAGIVEHRQVAPGVYVQVGQPIVSLVRTDPLRFRAGVPERQAIHLRPRQKAEIRVEGQAEMLRGEVSRISPALEMSNRALTVEIDLPNPESRLRVGLFAEAAIVVELDARTLTIPATAVGEFAGVEKVWVVRDGQAAETIVTIGRRQRDRVEVLAGLSAGDLVVTEAEQGRAGPIQAEGPAPPLAREAK